MRNKRLYRVSLRFLREKMKLRVIFGEWQALKQILPILQQLIEQRQRIYECQQCSNVLQKELEDVSKCALEAQEKRDLVVDRASKLAQGIEHLQTNIELRQRRLTELASIVAEFAQVESLQEQVVELQVQMRMFPSNLAQHLQEAEQKIKQLAQIEKVLPWMKLFAQARSDLAKVVADEQDADDQTEVLQTRLQECGDHREQLNVGWLEAQAAERDLLAKKTSASRSAGAWRLATSLVS
jgi:chromosome segregation ATPase